MQILDMGKVPMAYGDLKGFVVAEHHPVQSEMEDVPQFYALRNAVQYVSLNFTHVSVIHLCK